MPHSEYLPGEECPYCGELMPCNNWRCVERRPERRQKPIVEDQLDQSEANERRQKPIEEDQLGQSEANMHWVWGIILGVIGYIVITFATVPLGWLDMELTNSQIRMLIAVNVVISATSTIVLYRRNQRTKDQHT